MLASEGSVNGPDAPPKKPKQPFLKRGEGVKKRLDAYKYRRPADSLKQTSSEQQATSDHADQQRASPSPRKAKQPPTSHVWEPEVCFMPDVGSEQQDVCSQQHSSALGKGAEFTAGQDATHWSARQAEEALELEEFRALEREILGSSQHQEHQPQQQQHQQQERSQVAYSQASAFSGNAGGKTAARGTEFSAAAEAEAAAAAAYGMEYDASAARDDCANVDLSNQCSTQMVHFQDDTEWVDTEFSFAGLTQPQQRQQHHQQQQQHDRMLQQHERQPPQQEPQCWQQHQHQQQHSADTRTDGMLDQPFVRSLFKAAAGSNISSNTATGSGRPTSAGRSRHQAAAAGTAARSRAAAAAEGHVACGDVVGVLDGGVQLLAVPADQVAKWQQIEAAQPDMQKEKEKLRKMRVELERAATRLEQERSAWEKQKATAQASLEVWRSEEARRLARERRVLEQQSKALLQLPSKKEKAAMEGLQAQLDREKAEAKAAAARHRLTVERLRCQIKELQERCAELREEVRWHEAQHLNSTAFAAHDSKSRRKPPTATAQTQTDAVLHQQQQQQQSGGATAAAAAVTAIAAAAAKFETAAGSTDCAAGSSSTNSKPSAAAAVDPLYAALFGDDADEDATAVAGDTGSDIAANGACRGAAAVAVTGRPTAGPAAAAVVMAAASPSRSAAAAAGSPSRVVPLRGKVGSSRSQLGSAGPQVGRKVVNNITLKPSVSWADEGCQEQQQRQDSQQLLQNGFSAGGHMQQFAAGRQAFIPGGGSSRLQQRQQQQQQAVLQGADGSGSASTYSDGAGIENDDSFTFAPVTSNAAAANGNSSYQQQHNPPAVGCANVAAYQGENAGSSLCNTSFTTIDNYLADQYDKQQQQQQQPAVDDIEKSAAGSAASRDAGYAAATCCSSTGSSVYQSSQLLCADQAAAAAAAVSAAVSKQGPAASSSRQQQQQQQRVLIQQLSYPDGKVEKLYADGSRIIQFANGTVKTCRADGSMLSIRFTNGDIKLDGQNGKVDYYYAEVATWQSSHASGLEVYYFPSGQVEGHYPDGVKDIIFPDGSIRRVLADGSEEDITAGMLAPAVCLPPPDMDSMQ